MKKNNQYFNLANNRHKIPQTRRENGIDFKSKNTITEPLPSLLALNEISNKVEALKSDFDHRKDTIISITPRPVITSVRTENTYFSNFAPTSAVPFAKDSIFVGLEGTNSTTKEQIFDYFTIPDKRALLLTYLECRIAPYADEPGPYRITQFAGDDEFMLYGLGFSLIANKITNTFLAQSQTENPSGTPYVITPPADSFGVNHMFNQNVLDNNTSPAYLTFIENLNVRVKMQWKDFPVGLGGDPGVTKYTVLVRGRGYLLNINEYYRFVDSTRSVDASPYKPIK
jgi:hypothetical protein